MINKSCILVHGAWHASWAWRKVVKPLQKYGFKNVLTPDLPGHGNNKLINYKDITLNKYVDHITKLTDSLNEPIILVGHSMAGVIISQVAENIPDKIGKLIYVAGFVPNYNGCLIDEEKLSKNPTVALEVKIDEAQCSISLENSQKIRELFYNKCNDADIEYALKYFQKQPLLPFIEKVSLTHEKFGKVPKLYIECLQDHAISLADQQRMYSKIICDVKSIDTDHSPFFSASEELTSIIGSIANYSE